MESYGLRLNDRRCTRRPARNFHSDAQATVLSLACGDHGPCSARGRTLNLGRPRLISDTVGQYPTLSEAIYQRELRRSPAAIWAANTRQGIVWPRRNCPVRGVAPRTMPHQRLRMSQPSILTSTPVSSPRHNCHRSSIFTMPATAARWGRAPASRRAAIRTSAGVRTLTTPGWARAALDDHRGRGPRKASHATAIASACHRRATASGRRKCRISR